MGIMILIQKAAILFLIAASMVSTLIMAAVFKWRDILPKSKSGKGVFSVVSFFFFVVFYTLILGYVHNFWVFSFEIIDALPIAQDR